MEGLSKQLMENNKSLTESIALAGKNLALVDKIIDENKDLTIFLGIIRAQLFDANKCETVLTMSIDAKLKKYERKAK